MFDDKDLMDLPLVDIFTEGTDYDDAESLLVNIMLHLLKLKYFTDTSHSNDDGWERTVRDSRQRILTYIHKSNKTIQFGNFKENDKYSKYYNDKTMGSIYEKAVIKYKSAAKKYDDLKDGLKYIPDDCPWTFVIIMNTNKVNDRGNVVPNYKKLISYLPR